MPELADWSSFYGIVGSAAGALIGLQFVAVALIAQRTPLRAPEAGPAFATPPVVHFSVALFLSALLRAPWGAITIVAALWGLIGYGGAAYALLVARRVRRQSVYEPEVEDWLFHAALPLTSYALLVVSQRAAHAHTRAALFGVGTSTLLLLLVGIHNTWDGVAYHMFVNLRSREPEDGTSDAERR